MKDKTTTPEPSKKVKKVQFNVRLPEPFRESLHQEINRIGRKRDMVTQRIFEHFLSLKPKERDLICSPKDSEKNFA